MSTLFIDSREPVWVKTILPSFFETLTPPIKCEIKELYAGDLRYGNLLIERKEINDFCNSVVEGRMKMQKIKMCELIADDVHPYVLIHGKLEDTGEHGLSKRSFMGAIASLNEYGIHTIQIPAQNIESICECVYALIRKFNEDKRLKVPFIEPDGRSWTQKALMCIKGIGDETAKNIVEQFSDDLKTFYQCDKDTLKKGLLEVENVGEKTADTIIKTIYNMED